jgi:hypothetical protein
MGRMNRALIYGWSKGTFFSSENRKPTLETIQPSIKYVFEFFTKVKQLECDADHSF